MAAEPEKVSADIEAEVAAALTEVIKTEDLCCWPDGIANIGGHEPQYDDILNMLRAAIRPAVAARRKAEQERDALASELRERERDIQACRRAFDVQEAFEVEGRAGKYNALQISEAWITLERRAEAAEARIRELGFALEAS